jgi:hypothetical protein
MAATRATSTWVQAPSGQWAALGLEPRTYSFKIDCCECYWMVRQNFRLPGILRTVTAGVVGWFDGSKTKWLPLSLCSMDHREDSNLDHRNQKLMLCAVDCEALQIRSLADQQTYHRPRRSAAMFAVTSSGCQSWM